MDDPGEDAGVIVKAMAQYGYRQQEIAEHLGLHYSSLRRIVKVDGFNERGLVKEPALFALLTC